MTEKPEEDRVVTVAELLARHGQVSGTAGRAHRRRAREGGISVAELTGEIPIIRADEPAPEAESADAVPAEDSTTEDSTAEDLTAEDLTAEDLTAEDSTTEDPAAEAVDAVPAEVAADDIAADETAAAEPLADETEAPRAYSALDAVADAGPQSPREFASTSAFPAMAPLAGSIMSADAANAGGQAVERTPTEGIPAEAAPTEETAIQETAHGEESAHAPLTDDTIDEPQKGALRQWLALAAQAVVGVAVGAALFIGFGRLWENDTLWPVALVLAILVILAMVAVVRILRKTDDIFSLLLAVVVGIIVTIGPLVLVKSTT